MTDLKDQNKINVINFETNDIRISQINTITNCFTFYLHEKLI
jgi:hypothetical protein